MLRLQSPDNVREQIDQRFGLRPDTVREVDVMCRTRNSQSGVLRELPCSGDQGAVPLHQTSVSYTRTLVILGENARQNC